MNKFSKTLQQLFGITLVLVSISASFQVNRAAGAQTDMPSAVTPPPAWPDKNSEQAEPAASSDSSFTFSTPGPFSKNGSAQPFILDSDGETFAVPPRSGSKNFDSEIQSNNPSANLATALAAGGSLITCGVSGNLNWTTTFSSPQVIRQCTITVPQAGRVFISANSSLAVDDSEYEGRFGIGVDSTSADPAVDRWVNIYNDGGDGTDKSLALSILKPVVAGTHTVYFLGSLYAGTGTLLLFDPTLTVIFIPETNSQLLACGASGTGNWTTTSSAAQVIRQCSLSLPSAGWVFFSADSSASRQDGEYEVRFGFGIDSTNADNTVDRWVNVYNDSGDGTDKHAGLTGLKPVSAGAHTFNFLGSRYSGAGTVLLLDPTLTVIFIPSANAQAVACGASGDSNWTTTSSTFQVIRQCILSVPQAGWVYISADGSVAREDGEYEGRFGIGIDAVTADSAIGRWVNVYNDSGDGTDEALSLSVLKAVSAGTHTFYFLGSRYSGTGIVRLIDPTLTVIAPGANIFLPLIMRSQ